MHVIFFTASDYLYLDCSRQRKERTMTHAAILVAIMAAATVLLRFLPFLVFSGKKTPDTIIYLGSVLPQAIIAMLVVYCLRQTDIFHAPFGFREGAAVAVVIGLQCWKRNSLLSILGGTVTYMLLMHL